MRKSAGLVLLCGCALDVSGLRERDLAVLGVVVDGGSEAGDAASAEGSADGAAPETGARQDAVRGDTAAEVGDAPEERETESGATDAGGHSPPDAPGDQPREAGDSGAAPWDGGACGAPRAPCCPGSACAEDTVCVQGSCMPCGTLGSLCCVTRCETATACAAGFCVSCGLQGRVCCDGMRCSGGATCRVDGLCR